jgi:hypothetical protein
VCVVGVFCGCMCVVCVCFVGVCVLCVHAFMSVQLNMLTISVQSVAQIVT